MIANPVRESATTMWECSLFSPSTTNIHICCCGTDGPD
jgi:hypothetical protein